MILSLLIEATTGSYHQAVADRVFTPAEMSGGGFFRTDDLPANTALGYLDDGRSNVFHLPVIGMGDGGAFLTLDDTRSYGRGFWVGPGADHVWFEGMDAGVSFQPGVFSDADVRYSVLSNDSSGVWPLVRSIRAACA